MKLEGKLLVTFFSVLMLNAISPEQDWESPSIIGINKESARATFFPYESKSLAEIDDPSESQFYKTLNGNWAFHWVRNSDDRPKEFY